MDAFWTQDTQATYYEGSLVRYTIQQSPAGIFPTGENDAVMLTNVGPVTIYLDSTTAVNAASYPLRPSASIPWDPERPLFAVVRTYPDTTSLTLEEQVTPEGILEVTRNSSLADKTLPARITLAERQYTINAATPDTVGDLGVGFLETGTFERLTIQYRISSDGFGTDPANDKFYVWNLFWYDENFEQIRTETYTSIWRIDAFTAPSDALLTIAPKGQYLVVFCSIQGTSVGTDSDGRQFLLTVTGNSIDDFGNYPYPGAAGQFYGAGASAGAKNTLAIQGITTALADQVYINSTRRLTLNWRSTAAVSTAGFILIRGIRQGVPAPEYGILPIPTSAGSQRQTETFDIPESEGLFLDILGVVTAGVQFLSITEHVD